MIIYKTTNLINKKLYSIMRRGKKHSLWLGYLKITDSEGNIKIYDTAVEAAKALKVNVSFLRRKAKARGKYLRGRLKNHSVEIINEVSL